MNFWKWLISLFTRKSDSPAIPQAEPERPSVTDQGKKTPWYPLATVITPGMKTRGKYKNGWPVGAVIHYTAGRDNPKNTIAHGRESGYAYFCIDRKGDVYQAHPANEWGYHAGVSKWPGLGSGVSQYLAGIEVISAGRVDKDGDNFKTWFGTSLTKDDVRYSAADGNIQKGYYHKFTPEQEEALIKLLMWFKQQSPEDFKFEYVIGHDEAAPDRKQDPGAALSMPMRKFRETLFARWVKGGK